MNFILFDILILIFSSHARFLVIACLFDLRVVARFPLSDGEAEELLSSELINLVM